jgi:beta-xylosidase
MGYRNNGVAQGGIVDTPTGQWYAVLFQDRDAVGRVPCVLPMTWEEGWPVIGADGKSSKSFEVPLPHTEPKPLVIGDEFDYKDNRLALNWQWNHNPDNRLWSVTARPGWLRLRTGYRVDSVEYARNTLTQRTEGPACSASTLLETASMKPGDRAGMVALASHFGAVGIQIDEKGNRHIYVSRKGNGGEEETIAEISFLENRISLKIDFIFEDGVDLAFFYYSEDGESWQAIGQPLRMKYTLHHFMGYRIGLFAYAAKETGGYADFDYFRYARNADKK